MPTDLRFFDKKEETTPENTVDISKSQDIKSIFSSIPDDALLLMDIDDTVGRLPQSIGLDPWFRFRIEQFVSEGHEPSQALSSAIEIYNQVQFASHKMIPLDKSVDIGREISSLKLRGVKVIGLTARNKALTDITHEQLRSLNVAFSENVLTSALFDINGRVVEINEGVIFADGSHKGKTFRGAEPYFLRSLSDFSHVTFVDDSQKNCRHVVETFEDMALRNTSVWHYQYAEEHHPFLDKHKTIAGVQEQYFQRTNLILTDKQAEDRLDLLNTAPLAVACL
jgi:hypothetical protein